MYQRTLKQYYIKYTGIQIFLSALLLQIAHLYYQGWGKDLVSSYALSDAALYLHYAWFKAFIDPAGGMLGEIVPPSPYILFQVAAYKLFGFHYHTPFIVNSLLFSGAATFMYYFSRNLFNEKTAWISAYIFIFCGPLFYYSTLTMKTVNVMFMLAACLFFLERSLRTLKFNYFIALSVFLALLILERNNFLLEAPLILLLAFIGTSSKGLIAKRMAYLALPCLLVLIGFIHIFSQAHSTSPIGINLYSGNSKIASGSYVVLEPLIRDDLIGSHQGPARVAEEALGKKLSRLEANWFWIEKTLADIQDQPLSFLKIIARKALMVLSRDAPGSPEQYALWRWENPFLSIAIFDHGLILALALLGIFLLVRKGDIAEKKVFIAIPLIYSLTVILFFINERYRFPIMISLIPFAAYALASLWSCRQLKQKAVFALSVLLLYSASYLLNTVNPIGPGWASDPVAKRKQLLKKNKINRITHIYKRKALTDDKAHHWQKLAKIYQRHHMPADAAVFLSKAQTK